MRAEADLCIMSLPRNPKHKAQFAPTAVIFGGPNSPEIPDSWENSWDLFVGRGAHEYHVSPSELRMKQQTLANEARDEFVQKLITMDWENDDLEAIARHLERE